MSPLNDFLTSRLSAILSRPDAWGPPVAVELQILLLVEAHHAAAGAPADVVDGTMTRWLAHAEQHIPGRPFLLAGRLGLENKATPQFVRILEAFVEREVTK